MIRSPFLSGDPRKNQAAKIENLFQKNPGSSSRQRFFPERCSAFPPERGPAAPLPLHRSRAGSSPSRQNLSAGQDAIRRTPGIARRTRRRPAATETLRRNGNSPQHKALPPHGALSSAPDYRRSSSTSSGTPSAARLRMTVSGLRMPDTSGLPGSTR